MTEVFGRLAPNASVEQARAEIKGISSHVFADHPEAYEKASRYAIDVNQLRVAVNERASLTLWLLWAQRDSCCLLPAPTSPTSRSCAGLAASARCSFAPRSAPAGGVYACCS